MRLFTLITMLLVSANPAFAREGHDQGNGGDLYAAEFVEAAERVLRFLQYNDAKDVDLKKLAKAIEKTKVESTDEVLRLNGLPKDAINYPAQGRIIFNRKRWTELEPGQKPVLVLHEYLGLLGVEDASYAFSKKIIGAFTYDISYSLDCEFKGSKSNLNIGIDESAGMDTILLSVNWDNGKRTDGDVMRPVGEFSRMIRDGNFSLSLNDKYLLSLRASGKPLGMDGHFASGGKVYEVGCKIVKWDLSLLENFDSRD